MVPVSLFTHITLHILHSIHADTSFFWDMYNYTLLQSNQFSRYRFSHHNLHVWENSTLPINADENNAHCIEILPRPSQKLSIDLGSPLLEIRFLALTGFETLRKNNVGKVSNENTVGSNSTNFRYNKANSSQFRSLLVDHCHAWLYVPYWHAHCEMTNLRIGFANSL